MPGLLDKIRSFALFPGARRGTARPRLLVVTETYDDGLVVADRIERLGFNPVFVSADEIARAEALHPVPAAALILQEVKQKVEICTFLRASGSYAGKPMAVILALIDGGLAVPADAAIRPPSSLTDAIAHIKRQLRA